MDKAKLEERKSVLETQFKQLEERRKALVDQGSEIQRQISAIYTEQIQLQGSFKEIQVLLDGMKEPMETLNANN